nr:DUF3105 domain-containing protein [Microlunatus panaciterrae]
MRSASIAELGLSPAAAACQPVQENPATGNQQHVADGTKVNYDRLPPDSGAHLNHWAPFAKKFYTAEERPVVEELVHNLEHGYTIAWYNPDMPKDQLKDLEWIAKTFNGGDYVKDKFIAAPWTPADGKAFPAGQNIILTHWYANPQDPGNAATQKGVRMGCGGVSGQAIKDFMAKYPSTSAPEPQGG